jgi:Tol biopolymer transport system component
MEAMRRHACGWLMAGAVLALQLAAPQSVAAAAQVEGFVAVTTGSGSMQISAFNVDGSHERRLTSGPADHHYPSMSADGRRLAYVGDDNDRDEVYSLDLADPGAKPRPITSPPLIAESPSWSPNGQEIAFSATLLGRAAYDIFVARADGSRIAQITHGTDAGSSQPVYSPDGSRIAYINGRAGDDRIWVMNADGSGARPLTAGPLDAYPAWLDDSTIMFAREDPAVRRSAIMRVNLDGSVATVSPPGFSLVEPRPMPGGGTYGATELTSSGLHLVTVTGSSVVPIALPAADGEAYTMSWIPMAPAEPSAPVAALPFIVGAGGLGLLAAAFLFRRRRLYKNERLLV